MPMSWGDSRCAAIPDPTTIATSSPVPRNSADSRRPNGASRCGAGAAESLTSVILTNPDTSVNIEAMNTERTSELERRAAVHAALADPARLLIIDTLRVGDASPSELAAMLAMPSNLLAHHVKVLESEDLITRRRSDGDRRRLYLQLVPGALDAVTSGPMRRPRRVLFVCTANSARSHLAAALWRRASKVPATSGGTHPGVRIDPGAITAAKRHGLPLRRIRPTLIADVQAYGDLVITVCDLAHEELGELVDVHWSVPDPVVSGSAAAFDKALDELTRRVGDLASLLSAS